MEMCQLSPSLHIKSDLQNAQVVRRVSQQHLEQRLEAHFDLPLEVEKLRTTTLMTASLRACQLLGFAAETQRSERALDWDSAAVRPKRSSQDHSAGPPRMFVQRADQTRGPPDR
eukprot:TRINITY_DN21171_c0_g1_i1.p3 TRINITY_DN21171_c0_g1~~TRINITY_DN21171_c0_g1_i1.p3  ORF type:complete len:114 (+),score=21.96 TRINITY_DN21171_c0_g1_i1:271-612(+)